MGTAPAAVGCSIHTGWAVAVAVAGPPAAPTVVHRARVELVDPALPRQVFHAAAAGPRVEAEALVRRVERSAREESERALTALRAAVEAGGHRVAVVALCTEPRDIPTDLARILASHTLLHSAEGELYREALEAAAEWLGLPVTQVGPKRISTAVADGLGLSAARQQAILADLGKALGPPWRADHKQATLLAALALADCRVR